VYYVDRETIRRFEPDQRHVKAEPGYGLLWTEHRPSWVIERWIAREEGITLAGPDPKTLIDPVTTEEFREGARGELVARLANWSGGVWPMKDLAPRASQAYEIETACRALCTIETGMLPSKRAALAWASEHLPPEWRPVFEFAERHHSDDSQDTTEVERVLAFVRYASERATMAAE
jgi:hypothetical protein